MQTTLVRQAVVALALGATAAAASALPAFTFNGGQFTGGSAFTADKIAISDYATVTLNPGTSTFSETGLLSISSFQYLGKDLAVTGLNSTYGLYIAFSATGNVTAANPTTTATSGSFNTLSYQLYGYNGTATFGVAAGSAPTVTFSNAGTTTGTLLGTGSLGAGGNFLSTAPTGTSLFANAGATLNFTPVQQSFFVSPTPFYNMAFSSFTNTPDTVTAFNGGFSIANGGGTISFITAVPEPETYALMLAGLGVMGFVARRRQAK